MRSLLLTTAAVAAAIGLAGCSKTPTPKSVSTTLDTLAVAIDTQAVTHDTLPIMYDTLIDTRDGQTYKTVKIDKQTWMAENLNYQTQSGSWCYNDSASYCKQYGRLYDWKTATTVCPKGWKLPSREDWDYLGQAVGGEKMPYYEGMIYWYGAGQKLKSKSGWNDYKGKNGNGTDDYGFSALSGGYRGNDGEFGGAGNGGGWWTATEHGSNYAYYRGMGGIFDSVNEDDDDKRHSFSVRCVADN
ncbi:MAG: fibrobacter succinogenes major paralogous domain-containing protein [Chitinispirillales bacterium]|jgi:uncharacterized protein (TIGR02145 family)|nr:fibrobacter succinogenes major paralogous domain-containing protein [Chitinispirillales bacterium]